MKNINKKFTSEEAIIKMLFEKGILNEDEIIDVLNFVKTLTHLTKEYNMCLSVSSSEQNIETVDDFEITLKNIKSGNRYDLKLIFALLAGVDLQLRPVEHKGVKQ